MTKHIRKQTLYQGLRVFGWLVIGNGVWSYAREVDTIGPREVLFVGAVLLIALGYWLVWARPRLRAGNERALIVAVAPLLALQAICWVAAPFLLAAFMVLVVSAGMLGIVMGSWSLHTLRSAKNTESEV